MSSAVQYLSLSGPLSLMVNGWVDFTFEWELLIHNPQVSGYPTQFLQKGPLVLMYDQGNKLNVAIGAFRSAFSGIFEVEGTHISSLIPK